jgi:microcystin-dependent protein
MGFSGGGSSATRAHTHDSTIINDGGSLNFDNITQGGAAMTAGAITYSDGPAGHMQVLTLGAAGDVLEAGAAAPQWVTPGGSVVTSGMVSAWAGGAAPTGWLLCDGSSVATATYPDLFTAIGYAYGGAGANFNLPNLVDVFVRGQSSQTAATGGANSKTLAISEIPSHTHTVNDPGHNHASPHSTITPNSYSLIAISGSSNNRAYQYTTSNTTGITNNNTGGGSSFDNQPAYLELQYIIKT